MKNNLVIAASLILLVASRTLAQPLPSTTPVPTKLTREQRQVRKTERLINVAHMTPAERQAFKRARYQQRQAKLQAMSPDKRAKAVARRQIRKALRQS